MYRLKNLTINFWVLLAVVLVLFLIIRYLPQELHHPDNWWFLWSFYTFMFSAGAFARYHSKRGVARIKQTQDYFGFNYQTAKWFLIGSYVFMIAVFWYLIIRVFPKILGVLIN